MMTKLASAHPGDFGIVGISLLYLPLLDTLAERRSRRRIRRTYGAMSDRQLWDAGLTWHDVCGALALPLGQSAEAAVGRAARDGAQPRLGSQ